MRDGWRLRREHPAAILLLAWATIVVIAFSLSMTQLPHYVLPAIPPLALITGAYLADRLAQANPGGWFRMGLALTVPMGVLPAVGAWVGLWYFGYWHNNYAFAAAGLLGIAAAGTWLLLRRNYSAALAFLAAGIVFAMTFVFTADPLHIYQNYSTRYEVNVLKKALQPGDAVIAYPYTPYSTAWYLWPRPIPYPTAGPPSEEPSVLLLVAEMNQPRRTFCMLQKAATLEVLRREVRWPIRVLSAAPNHTLIVTEPPEKPAP
jgi:4-amino-4-deoxy-L-arabinose transferase-like glycosyltransferase